MSHNPAMVPDLRAHIALCQELLRLAEQESRSLKSSSESFPSNQFCQQRKTLLARLEKSVVLLKQHRLAWQKLPSQERQHSPEVSNLLRMGQDLSMRLLMIDRDNEQALLKRGLLPAKSLPPQESQRPHYVANLYRQNKPN